MSAPTREEVIKRMAKMDKDYPDKLSYVFEPQITEEQRLKIKEAWAKCYSKDVEATEISIKKGSK